MAREEAVMLQRPMSAATHTVELTQLAEIDDALRRPGAPAVTAADLGLTGAEPGAPAAAAVITDVAYQGPPEYPYIYGGFGTGTSGPYVELHTPALRELSKRLHLHHVWGA